MLLLKCAGIILGWLLFSLVFTWAITKLTTGGEKWKNK